MGKMNKSFQRNVTIDQARRTLNAQFAGKKNGTPLYKVRGGVGRPDLFFTGNELQNSVKRGRIKTVSTPRKSLL